MSKLKIVTLDNDLNLSDGISGSELNPTNVVNDIITSGVIVIGDNGEIASFSSEEIKVLARKFYIRYSQGDDNE